MVSSGIKFKEQTVPGVGKNTKEWVQANIVNSATINLGKYLKYLLTVNITK